MRLEEEEEEAHVSILCITITFDHRIICSCSPFHWKPSCNRKNSRKAGSCLSSPSCLVLPCCCCCSFLSSNAEDFLLCGEREPARERHICASNPSICRKPFRILELSREEMLSNERLNKDSMIFLFPFFLSVQVPQQSKRASIWVESILLGVSRAYAARCLGWKPQTSA